MQHQNILCVQGALSALWLLLVLFLLFLRCFFFLFAAFFGISLNLHYNKCIFNTIKTYLQYIFELVRKWEKLLLYFIEIGFINVVVLLLFYFCVRIENIGFWIYSTRIRMELLFSGNIKNYFFLSKSHTPLDESLNSDTKFVVFALRWN